MAQGVLDNMPVYSDAPPQGGGALSALGPMIPSPFNSGDPLMGMLGRMMQPTGLVAQSPLTQALSDTSQKLLANPEELPGALTRAATARDAATQDKMAAIQRAMAVLSNFNAPAMRLASSAALGTPAINVSSQAPEQMLAERAAEGSNALDLMKLGLLQAGLPEENAEATANDIYKRLQVGEQTGNAAMMGQYRDELGRSRMMTPIINSATRLKVADINSNKGRYSYIGPSEDDPSVGMYLDRSTGQAVPGPGIGPRQTKLTPDAAITMAQKDYERIFPKPAPNDTTPRAAPPEGMMNWIKKRASAYQNGALPVDGGAQTEQQPSGSQQNNPPPQGAAAPPPPKGVPATASYSPSQKRWWWKSPDGKSWQHN